MKRARFSEEQIITILKEAEGGAKVTELCRRHGISDATFYTWRSKYGGLEVSEMRRLRQLEEENRRLKSIVADQALDIRALKDVLAKDRRDAWSVALPGSRGLAHVDEIPQRISPLVVGQDPFDCRANMAGPCCVDLYLGAWYSRARAAASPVGDSDERHRYR